MAGALNGPDIAPCPLARRAAGRRSVWCEQAAETLAYESSVVRAALGADDLAVLAAYAATARWPAGFTVYQRGCEADGLFVVLSGQVVLRTRLKGGRAYVPRLCSAGELFGAEGLAAHGVYQTDARAESETLTLHLSRARLRTLLCERAATALALAEQVGVSHGQLLDRLRELSMLSVEQRLLAAVERTRAQRHDVPADQPLVLDAAGYRLLCEMVGATRESVSLALGRLMREGLAERDGGRVLITAMGGAGGGMGDGDAGLADAVQEGGGARGSGRREAAQAGQHPAASFPG